MSAIDPTSTTGRTEGLNRVLLALGQSPAASFPVAGNQALADLESVFDEATKDIAMRKWYFNTEIRSISPGVGPGYTISLPNGIIDMDPTDKTLKFVMRATSVYDLDRNSTSFEGLGPYEFECLRGLPFSELPEPFKAWIIARAARVYTQRFEGENEYFAALLEDERTAEATALSYEFRSRDKTLFDNPALGRLHRRRQRWYY